MSTDLEDRKCGERGQATSANRSQEGQEREAAAMASGEDPARVLRKQAEERAGARGIKELENLTPEETRRLLHELHVHQVELEMQNEELQRAQQELEASRGRYFDLYDLAPVGYVTLSERGLILEANLRAATLLEAPRTALLKQPLSRFIDPQDQDVYHLNRVKLKKAGDPQVCELRLARKAGTQTWVRLEMTSSRTRDTGVFLCQAVMHDITERKLMEAEVRRSRDELELRVQERTAELERAVEELHRVPARLITVQEEERKRLAGELHDSIGQTLAALKLYVEHALDLKGQGNIDEAFALLDRFVPVLLRSIDETRAIYTGLRPRMLEERGLIETLQWTCREFMRLYPAHYIEPAIEIEESMIPEPLKIAIFRIVQESLNNIVKHSKAEWVDLSLRRNGRTIELTIQDDGAGMDVGYLSTHQATARSLGLVGMRERAELTGERLSIESTPGEGTIVRASWPVGERTAP